MVPPQVWEAVTAPEGPQASAMGGTEVALSWLRGELELELYLQVWRQQAPRTGWSSRPAGRPAAA